jgi:diacylglycerol kinase (ATP)
LYRNVPNLRVLVCGGDGSVGWVLSVIEQTKFLAAPPPVAILPLGTGNDLARALNWGATYADNEPPSKILARVLDSRTVRLDRWQIRTTPDYDLLLLLPPTTASSSSSPENKTAAKYVTQLGNNAMNNYFSLGCDAHVCLEFHERRGSTYKLILDLTFTYYFDSNK